MIIRSSMLSTVLFTTLIAVGSAYAQTANVNQTVTLNEKLKIPGASLKPGDYTFAIEDRLQDRAIVRVTSQDQSKYYLLLTVPSDKLGQAGSDGLIRFNGSNGKSQVLRGWACSGCKPGLEFVYPKAEAAKLTEEAAEPVLAVDPSYDKLPSNLSADDMKVVTLWLLSPERITASNKGKGLKAEKYAAALQSSERQTASVSTSEVPQTPAAEQPKAIAQVTTPAATPAPTADGSTSELAQVPAPAATSSVAVTPPPAAAPTEVASTNSPEHSSGRLPKTASSDYLYLFAGMLLVLGSLGVRLSRRSIASSHS